MQRDTYRREWQAIVNRAWQRAPARQKKGQSFIPRYNTLYEDLFGLPQNAPRFIRTYFLRIRLLYSRDKQDPRSEYSSLQEAGIVSWKITARFLRGVMNMDEERVEQIRLLGDRLADYVKQSNDGAFFRHFYVTNHYDELRTVLLRANLALVRQGKSPIIEFDPYITIFEDGEYLARLDWKLARDLVLIRMIECLHKVEWFKGHAENIPEREVEPEDTEED
jgi:CRISPR-associated protein Cst1